MNILNPLDTVDRSSSNLLRRTLELSSRRPEVVLHRGPMYTSTSTHRQCRSLETRGHPVTPTFNSDVENSPSTPVVRSCPKRS